MRKSPKNLPEGKAPLGTPLGGHYHPPSGDKRRSPQKREALRAARKPHNHLPSHGLAAGSVTPGVAWGKKKTDLPTSSKWQIGLLLWLKVARRETERSAASAKRAAATHRGIPKGAALGAPLVTFPATGKSPGCRAERLHQGSLGLPAPQKPPGSEGRSALPATSTHPAPRGRQLGPARNQCANWVQAQPALGLIFFIE